MKKIFFTVFTSLFFVSTMITGEPADMVKKPNVAGAFYPSDRAVLNDMLDGFFNNAGEVTVDGDILGIIAPHAGYVYSGPVAAYAYSAIKTIRVDTVVILAASHYYPFSGIAVYPDGAFETPSGRLNVDAAYISRLRELPFVVAEKSVFEQEHSLEVQLPFLQRNHPDVSIVPVIFGQADYAQAAALGEKLAGLAREKKILVIASTDLSHYHPYGTAQLMDKKTTDFMAKSDPQGLLEAVENGTAEACGALPVAAFLSYVNAMGGRVKVIKYLNSGDTAGDKKKVVGYAAAVAYKPVESQNEDQALNTAQKKTLLDIARKTLETYLSTGKKPAFKVIDPALTQVQGAFVTLHENGELRGCIGNYGVEPLYQTIENMAIAAATEDPRFPTVTKDDLKNIELEISVLSPLRKVASADDIVFGKHGVVVRKGFRQGVFLPQVAEQMRDKEEFLSYLCLHKAGLPADAWKDPGTELQVFTADVFSEHESKGE